MMKSHFEELGCSGEFDPNFPAIQEADKAGNMIILGAWDNQNLVGYLGWTLMNALIMKAKIALQSAWYVRPEYRKSDIGRRLMSEGLRILRSLNIDYAYPHFFITGDPQHDASMSRFIQLFGGIPRQTMFEIKLR